MKRFKLFVFGAICVVIGTIIIWPVQAHVVGSKNAHTFMRRHLNQFALVSWVKRNVFRKTQSDERYINERGTDTQWGRLNVNDIRYFNGINSGITIPAAAFRAGQSTDTYSGSSNGGAVYSSGKLIAPVILPNSAKLTSLTYYYYDSDANANSTVTFRKMAFNAQGLDEAITTASSAGSSGYGSKEVNLTLVEAINHGQNEYFLVAENTAANNQLVAVKIRYYIVRPY